MHILFCNYEYPPLGGGGGVVMAALARELAGRHQVTVLTSRALDLPPESIDAGVRVLRVPVVFRRSLAVANFPSMLMYLPAGLLRGLGLKRYGRIDVVNTHFVIPTGPVGAVISKLHNAPNILSVHGGDLYDPSKTLSPHRHAAFRFVVRRLLRSADAVVGQSRDTLDRVNSIYGVARDTELIPLGIERPPAPTADARAIPGLPPDDYLMVTVGRIIARKAAPQLVQVLANLRDLKARLLVVGDGPEGDTMRSLATQLGVQHRIHFLGQVSEHDKYLALSAADIFVSTSQHEGFGLVFLEAMSFGLPVICYDRGGQTDFLATPTTGAVIKLNDMVDFTSAVQLLRSQPETVAAIGRENRKRVEQYFIDTCAQRYESVFESVLRQRRGNC
jgi:glycosyltransferase involved in cell wall biosynthesis